MFFDDSKLAANPRSKVKGAKAPFVRKTLTYPIPELVPFELMSDDELRHYSGATFVYDIETYPNYCCIGFRDVATDKVVYFEQNEQKPVLTDVERSKLNWIIGSFRHVTFNGKFFDTPLMWLMVYGFDYKTIKYVADRMINTSRENKKNKSQDRYGVREIQEEFNLRFPSYNMIDLIELVPLKPSLKILAGRLHAKRMQDLPYDPAEVLTLEQQKHVLYYCVNDLTNTQLLFNRLAKEIRLREQLSEEYEQDLRSRSDAQIAEHVLTAECAKINGYFAKKPIIAPGTTFYYQPPAFIHFQTPMMQRVFDGIKRAPFVISDKGQPKCEFLKGLLITIGESVYKMGVGGLHSTESCVARWAKDGYLLIDRDVASYYPNIIINNGFFPEHLKATFITVYKKLVDKRLEAKGLSKVGDLDQRELYGIIADSLKITINGSFGKLGSKYSNLYSPNLLVQVTLTGQLSLLMLIEMLELNGVKVVSANTDGIVIMPHLMQYDMVNSIVAGWEQLTKFETEETQYKAVLSRDVNNYIALKKHFDKGTKSWIDTFPDKTKVDDMYKGKGVFGESSIKKQPTADICAKAIAELLINDTAVESFIRNNKNLADFITVKNVAGGAEKDGVFLGKAIRYYYGTNSPGPIQYISNGNRVSGSEGATPCMDWPDEFPKDVSYDDYINMTEDMLASMGYYGRKRTGKRQDLFDAMHDEKEESW
ncbi:putative DNA polymerase B region [Achromobacter phage vB_AxyS_19-32_Axy20]|nr:putative DNA polymerase B region [Achromobacter phage vB_AxyS_19-32_Axy20]